MSNAGAQLLARERERREHVARDLVVVLHAARRERDGHLEPAHVRLDLRRARAQPLRPAAVDEHRQQRPLVLAAQHEAEQLERLGGGGERDLPGHGLAPGNKKSVS